jgi:membrane-bound ClpP family serine protease
MKTKSIIAFICSMVLFVIGFILLIAEPIPGSEQDTFAWVAIEKIISIVVLAISGILFTLIDESDLENIKDWFNKF